jgi:hypothetical protein
VEFVLLGPTNDRRQLQDSPILGDVWLEFAARPAGLVDVLISPYNKRPAGPVATLLASRLNEFGVKRKKGQEADVAYLHGIIAARLSFRELLRVVVPMTAWWRNRGGEKQFKAYTRERLTTIVNEIIRWVRAEDGDVKTRHAAALVRFTALDRYVALAGLILWAGMQDERLLAAGNGVGALIDHLDGPDPVVSALVELFQEILGDPVVEEPQVWQVSLNRTAMPALERSVPAVKGDAARALFKVKCDEIAWAVIDSGIDGGHEAFRDADGKPRVERSFDFTNIRKIVSLDNLNSRTSAFDERLAELIQGRDLKEAEAAQILKRLAQDADNDRPIDWEQVTRFIEIDPASEPFGGHGTHVAGIIGASREASKPRSKGRAGKAVRDEEPVSEYADGMCPDIRLYDFRVLASSLQETEFAIIAALQYIRYLNERRSFVTVHGANLSLSIPHDVRNFACGRTPICIECERLVEAGVVVVAAAGNLGYHSFETRDGSYEGYTAFSITDPGNADGAITVGATHRFWPHTYGVSFFSSRGPTGDGRMKPDLVAPGERIESCLPGQGWGELDGTSMAAPHVSGAAAMLMARYSELIGQPRRIKQILCESATDLGRERSFQGHGMLDVLRALQKI